jgi:hypothetical protein
MSVWSKKLRGSVEVRSLIDDCIECEYEYGGCRGGEGSSEYLGFVAFGHFCYGMFSYHIVDVDEKLFIRSIWRAFL